MTVEGRAVLVTGANRGVGQALVEEALVHADGRVTPLTLDVTDERQTRAAAGAPNN
jgi:NAD(P)-dependent dehydrogenase (short-subunit alcohol dehydrogenase family)